MAPQWQLPRYVLIIVLSKMVLMFVVMSNVFSGAFSRH